MKSRRRGHGDRPQLRDGAAEGAALAREARLVSFHWGEEPRTVAELARGRRACPTDGRIVHGAAGAAQGRDDRGALRGDQDRPLVPRPDRAHQRGRRRDRRLAETLDADVLLLAKDHGFSDAQIAQLRGFGRGRRCATCAHSLGVRPGVQDRRHVRGRVPGAHAVPLLELRPRDRGGAVATAARSSSSAPARTASARASSSTTRACTRRSRCSDAGYETIMINCNPETVSTDYDTSDRLYFEPLTLEDVLEVIHAESQSRRARRRHRAARRADRPRAREGPRGGRRADPRHDARRDRPRRGARPVLGHPRRRGPARADATAPRSTSRARCTVAEEHRLPGARAPELRARRPRHGDRLRHRRASRDYFDRIAGQAIVGPGQPLLVDRFLDDAIEIDVDALYDGTELYIGGVMEHIEEAGIHSGDSSCTLPPVTLGRAEVDRVREATRAIAEGIGVRGLLNVQFAIGAGVLYVLEANPRASRTVPFVSKALGIPLAKAASRIMVGAHDRASSSTRGCCPASDGSRVPLDAPGRREGGRAAVQAVPHPRGHHGRLGARPRDALDRRGHGHRHATSRRAFAKSQDRRVRRACRCRARCSSRSPTATSARSSCRCCACSSSAYDIVATEGTAEVLAPQRHRGADSVQKFMRQARRRRGIRSSTSSTRGEIDVVDEHAERPHRPAPTATRSARRRSRPTSRCSRRSPSSAPRSPRSTRCAAGFEVTSLQEYATERATQRRRRSHDGGVIPLRRPARGRVRRLRAALRRHRPARRRCSRSGACPTPRRACASSACAWSMPRPAGSAS